jgi:transposase
MEKRQRFTAEFKREAVRQLKESGKPVATLARELGVARNKLYEWAELEKKHGAGAFPGSGRKPDDELTKLKRELERVKEENEILKKAAAYFAKNLP